MLCSRKNKKMHMTTARKGRYEAKNKKQKNNAVYVRSHESSKTKTLMLRSTEINRIQSSVVDIAKPEQ